MTPATAFLLLSATVTVVIIVRSVARKSVYTSNEHEFKQKNVRVVYAERRIYLSGRPFDVNQITGMSWSLSPIRMVTLQVDDIDYPLHHVKWFTSESQLKEFKQRLSTALRKAGGPSFY